MERKRSQGALPGGCQWVPPRASVRPRGRAETCQGEEEEEVPSCVLSPPTPGTVQRQTHTDRQTHTPLGMPGPFLPLPRSAPRSRCQASTLGIQAMAQFSLGGDHGACLGMGGWGAGCPRGWVGGGLRDTERQRDKRERVVGAQRVGARSRVPGPL